MIVSKVIFGLLLVLVLIGGTPAHAQEGDPPLVVQTEQATDTDETFVVFDTTVNDFGQLAISSGPSRSEMFVAINYHSIPTDNYNVYGRLVRAPVRFDQPSRLANLSDCHVERSEAISR